MLKLIKRLNFRLGRFLNEVISLVASKERLKQLWHIRFFSNAFYLMMSTGSTSLLSFIFWIVAARFYSANDVGLASATVAAMELLAGFSCLGLGVGLIRFLPQSGKNANSMINTVFTIGTLTSIIAVLIFIGGLGFWSPALLFIRQNPLYLAAFAAFTIISTITSLTSQTLVAKRRADLHVFRVLIFGLLRLPLPVVLASFLHSFGIFTSWGISLAVVLFVSIFLLLPRAHPGYKPLFTINRKAVSDLMHYSLANYVSDLFWGSSGLILPIMVINLLGAEPNAYFYIAWAIGGIFVLFPSAIAVSLFVEGSHEEEGLRLNVQRTLKMSFLIMVPLVTLVLLIADKLLLLFGGSYSENATTLLRILTVAALPLAINIIFLHIKRVEKKLRVIVGLAVLIVAVTLGLAYLLLPIMGINGAGIAWLASQSITALMVVASLFKGRRAISRVRV